MLAQELVINISSLLLIIVQESHEVYLLTSKLNAMTVFP